MTTSAAPTRVVILGAGPAALSAAWYLTQPSLEKKYDVTIYQVGWRAGGLCSTGRVPPQLWINQNGTHYLFGCYDGTLKLLHDAYDELIASGDARFGTFKEQLVPRNLVVLEQFFHGAWTQWGLEFPTNDLDPGVDQGSIPLDQALVMLIQWIIDFTLGNRVLAMLQRLHVFPDPLHEGIFDRIRHFFDDDEPTPGSSSPTFAALQGQLKSIHRSARKLSVGGVIDALEHKILEGLLKAFRAFLGLVLRPFAHIDLEACRAYMLLDLALTIAIGLLADDALSPAAMQKLDDEDFRAWLARHGADPITQSSPPVKVWYDAIAAYANGNPNAPRVATGATLISLAQMAFRYKGSIAFQLSWEAGDSIIAPVFQALRNRGVKFAFFHRVWDIIPDGDKIARVVLERQAELKSGDPLGYDPFILDPGRADYADKHPPRPVWPDSPSWDQIASPPAPPPPPPPPTDPPFPEPPAPEPSLESFWAPRAGKEIILEAGVDFDILIGGLGGAVYRYYGQNLTRAPAPWGDRWQGLLDNLVSIETQSLRFWFKQGLHEMGWTWSPPITGAFAQPYCVWEDPTPCLQSELWKDPEPRTVSHLFGPLETPLPDPSRPSAIGPIPWPAPDDLAGGLAYLASQQARAERHAQAWMTYAPGFLWPRTSYPTNPAQLDPSHLVTYQMRSNSGPTQAYTLIFPGTLRYRFLPGPSGFNNLFVCGDWTLTAFPTGSVEGAVLSGQTAASVILAG